MGRGLLLAMVVVGELDLLRDQGLAYAARLARDGVSVTCRSDPAMLHGYLGAAERCLPRPQRSGHRAIGSECSWTLSASAEL
jgi:acetyl esterase/lipase